jgi:hypothetical protein
VKKELLTKLNKMLEENPFEPPVNIKDIGINTKQIDTGHGIIQVMEHSAFNDEGMLVLSKRFLDGCFIYNHIN